MNVTENLKFILGKEQNIVGKGENAGYQHLFLFPQLEPKLSPFLKWFLKLFFLYGSGPVIILVKHGIKFLDS